MLIEHKKERIEDKLFSTDASNESYLRTALVRVFATRKIFTDIDFKQAVLKDCYFRNCTFIRCDFTGAQIIGSNLKGSKFTGCSFQYTVWEKTLLDEEFLENSVPSEENLARDLIRALRVNFSQVGNYQAVNRAASIEVRLSGQHLFNAAYASKTYYRAKYKGSQRLIYAWRHFLWKLLDLIWGNGESLLRVVLTAFATLVIAALVVSGQQPVDFVTAFTESARAFWGLGAPDVPLGVLAGLTIARFTLFGLFMAILVKRLSRR